MDRRRARRRQWRGDPLARAQRHRAATASRVDGETLPERERTRLFLYHKPRGLMTTHADPQGRPTIFQKLPKNLPRLISVGRLDFNTEGLILLTNDGALARVLGTAGDRLAAALPRARARRGDAGRARRIARRRHHQRHPLRRGRGSAGTRARLEPVAHFCDPRRQESRGAQRARPSRADRHAIHPGLVRSIPTRRTCRRRGRRGGHAGLARATRRKPAAHCREPISPPRSPSPPAPRPADERAAKRRGKPAKKPKSPNPPLIPGAPTSTNARRKSCAANSTARAATARSGRRSRAAKARSAC